MDWDTFWLVAERVSVVVAVVGIPYLIHQRRKYLPHLAFNGSGATRESFERDGMSYGRVRFTGSLQNRSLHPNTVEHMHLVVWRTNRRNSTRRFGSIAQVSAEDGVWIGPPISLAPVESKKVTVEYEIPLTGTADERLFASTVPLSPPSPHIQPPRYEYDLALEDVQGHLFDAAGTPRSRKAIALRLTVDNAWNRFWDGHPLPLVRHTTAIATEDVRFLARRLLRSVGL